MHASRSRQFTLIVFLVAGVLLYPSAGWKKATAVQRAPSIEIAYRFMAEGVFTASTAMLLTDAVSSADEPEELLEAGLLLGLVYEVMGEDDAARAIYQELSTWPRFSKTQRAWVHALWGHLELRHDDLAEAKDHLDLAQKMEPELSFVWFALGETAEAEGDVDTALQWYTKAGERSRDWLLPKVKAASIYNQKGEHGQAIALLWDLAVLGSRDVNYHLELSKSLAAVLHRLQIDADPALDETLIEQLTGDEDELFPAIVKRLHHALERVLNLSPGHPVAQSLLQTVPPLP